MSQEIHFNRSFKKFLFYLLLSAILGISGRYFVHNLIQQAWEPVRLEMEKKGVIASEPRLVLSRYGFPVLGGTIDELLVTQSWNCFTADIILKKVYAPFPWSALFSDSWKLSHMRIGSLELVGSEMSDECGDGKKKQQSHVGAEGSPTVKIGKSVSMDSGVQVGKSLRAKPQKWNRQVDLWFEKQDEWRGKNFLESVIFDEIKIKLSNLEDKHVSGLGYGEIEFSEDLELQLKFGSLEWKKQEKKILSEFVVKLKAGADQVHIDSRWTFNEGQFLIAADTRRDGKTTVALVSDKLPLSVLNRWVDTPWSFQYLWLNCSLSSSSESKSAWAASSWSAKDCHITSPHGEIRMLNSSLSSLDKAEELELAVSKLNLDKIIKNKQHLPLAGVLKQFGVMSGKMNLAKGFWTGALDVTDSAILFSRANLRRLQPVSKVGLIGSYGRGKYDIKLKDLELTGGDFEGEISLAYDLRKAEGQGAVDIHNLSFSEEIEDLMLKGKLSPIQINGRYELGRNFSPLKWSGHLSFSTFKGEGVELSSAKLGSLWKPDEGLSLKAAFGRLRLESSEVQPWLYASLLSESRGPIEVSQIKAKALLKDREFSWSELTGVSGKEKLASSGTYGKGRVFQGSWAWQSRVRKLSWEFKASKESVTWLPQEDGMKEWLKSHKDYMETYDFIRLDPVPGGS